MEPQEDSIHQDDQEDQVKDIDNSDDEKEEDDNTTDEPETQEGSEFQDDLGLDEHIIYMDERSSFVADITEGHVMRNLVDYLRGTNTKASFRFTKDKIIYEQADATQTVINRWYISADELVHYEFNSKTNEISIGLTLADVKNITKNVNKRDSLRLYKKPNDPMFYVQIISTVARASGRESLRTIRPQYLDVTVYEFPEFVGKRPNFTTPTSELARVCNSLNSVKCDIISARVQPRGIILEATVAGATVGGTEKLGFFGQPSQLPKIKIKSSSNSPQSTSPNISPNRANVVPDVIRIKKDVIKALAKLFNLSPTGTVKFYYDRMGMLKLVSHIGTCGMIEIYLRSYSEKPKVKDS